MTSGVPRSVHVPVPRFAMNTAPAKKSAAWTPAATACSCDATHLGRSVGSAVGDDLTAAVGGLVTPVAVRDALGTGERVGATLVGALQHTSAATRSKRSIDGR
jgi:hypothetical protein